MPIKRFLKNCLVLLCSAALIGCVSFSHNPIPLDGSDWREVKQGDVVRATLRSGDVVKGKVGDISSEGIVIEGRPFPKEALVSLERRTFSAGGTTMNTLLLGAGAVFGAIMIRMLALKKLSD